MKRVLVLGAGGPAGVNVCRALHEAGFTVLAQDDNTAHLAWAEPYSDGLQPGFSERAREEADLVLAQPDPMVRTLSDYRDHFPTFLPSSQAITLSQDKFECGLAWRRAGLREDRIQLVEDYGTLADAAAYLGDVFWLRARRGAGARGAILARSWREAQNWYGFWRARDREMDFIAEGYLPGRDLSYCAVYYKGFRVADMLRERLEYIYPHLTPEGLTGTPTVARIVRDEAAVEMAERAIRTLMWEPHGVFNVDMREDASGVARPTEINAGRFCTTIGLWSLYHRSSNLVALAARLGLGDDAPGDAKAGWRPFPEGLTLRRHIDCGHRFALEGELARV